MFKNEKTKEQKRKVFGQYNLRSKGSFLDASPDHIAIPPFNEEETPSSEPQETDPKNVPGHTSYKKMMKGFKGLLDSPTPISYCVQLDEHPADDKHSPNYVRCSGNKRLHKQHNHIDPTAFRAPRHYENNLERYPYRIDLDKERKTAAHLVDFTPQKKSKIEKSVKENIPFDYTANIQFSPGQNLASPLQCHTNTPTQTMMVRASKFSLGERRGYIFTEPSGYARTHEQTQQDDHEDILPTKLNFNDVAEEKLSSFSTVKGIGPVKINLSKLMKGLKRPKNRSQNKIYKYVAAKVAAKLMRFLQDDTHAWEWLHLAAYSFGCLKISDIQSTKNTVAGRKEINSQMMIIEHVIKDLLEKKDVSEVIITVEADVYTDPLTHKPTHLGANIRYIVEIPGVETLTYIFEPLKDCSWPSIKEFYYHRRIIEEYLTKDKEDRDDQMSPVPSSSCSILKMR